MSKYLFMALIVGCIGSSIGIALAEGADDLWDDILSDTQEEARETESFDFIARFQGLAAADTEDDDPFEDLYRGGTRLVLEMSYQRGDWLRARVEGVASYDVAGRNSDRTRDDYGTLLREANVGFTAGAFDLRLGQGILTWGKADFLNPTDVFNPPNIRQFIATEYAETKTPLIYGEASAYFGDFFAQLAVAPFFEPLDAALLGSDYAFLDVALHSRLELGGFLPIEGTLEELVYGLDRQLLRNIERDILTAGQPTDDETSLAFRFGGSSGPGAFTLTYAYIWDPLPATDAGQALDEALADETLDLTEVLALLPELFSETSLYHRTHVFGADFEIAAAGSTFRGEAAYYSKRTHYLTDATSVEKPWVWWVAGADRDLFPNTYVNVQLSGAHIIDASGEDFANFDEHTSLLTGLVQGRYLRERFLPEVRVVYSPSEGDFFVNPRIAWDVRDGIEAGIGAYLLGGERDTLFGQFSNNDEVYLFFEWAL